MELVKKFFSPKWNFAIWIVVFFVIIIMIYLEVKLRWNSIILLLQSESIFLYYKKLDSLVFSSGSSLVTVIVTIANIYCSHYLGKLAKKTDGVSLVDVNYHINKWICLVYLLCLINLFSGFLHMAYLYLTTLLLSLSIFPFLLFYSDIDKNTIKEFATENLKYAFEKENTRFFKGLIDKYNEEVLSHSIIDIYIIQIECILSSKYFIECKAKGKNEKDGNESKFFKENISNLKQIFKQICYQDDEIILYSIKKLKEILRKNKGNFLWNDTVILMFLNIILQDNTLDLSCDKYEKLITQLTELGEYVFDKNCIIIMLLTTQCIIAEDACKIGNGFEIIVQIFRYNYSQIPRCLFLNKISDNIFEKYIHFFHGDLRMKVKKEVIYKRIEEIFSI